MPSGLAALLDDVATMAKLAAASIDDVGAAAGRAGAKAAGVVIDDTAVTPRYVTGFTPDRELPIIWRIAKGSLRNKLLILLPGAMLISALLPWLLTPLLMLGGAYLCYEGAEKIWHSLTGAHHTLAEDAAEIGTPEHEQTMVSGAVRTDFILSAEIMAIALGTVSHEPLVTQAVVLFVVAIAITIGVYGLVAGIVKMDDIGLKLAQGRLSGSRAFGRFLVAAMPKVLKVLSVVGIAAMIWVGGGIIVHGFHEFGWHALPDFVHHAAEAAAHAVSPSLAGIVEWAVTAFLSGIVGLGVGAVIVVLHSLYQRMRGSEAAHH